jgi:hypothetical protein
LCAPTEAESHLDDLRGWLDLEVYAVARLVLNLYLKRHRWLCVFRHLAANQEELGILCRVDLSLDCKTIVMDSNNVALDVQSEHSPGDACLGRSGQGSDHLQQNARISIRAHYFVVSDCFTASRDDSKQDLVRSDSNRQLGLPCRHTSSPMTLTDAQDHEITVKW